MASEKSPSTLAKFIKGAAKKPVPALVIQDELPPSERAARTQTATRTSKERPDRKDKPQIRIYVDADVHAVLTKAARKLDRKLGAMIKRTLDRIAAEYNDDKGHEYLD